MFSELNSACMDNRVKTSFTAHLKLLIKGGGDEGGRKYFFYGIAEIYCCNCPSQKAPAALL